MKRLVASNICQQVNEATDGEAINLVREQVVELCQCIGEYMEVGKDANENRKTYDYITGLTAEEYVRTYADEDNMAEDLYSNYEEELEKADIEEAEARDAISDYLCESDFYNEEIINAFNEAVKQFLNEHRETPGFLATDKELIDTDSENEVYSASSLLDLNDKKGDVTRVLQVIDYFSRDGAFVYIDGEIVLGEANVPHQKILNDWLMQHNKELLEKKYGDSDNVVRPTITETKYKTGAKSVAFGHIDNGMAFIETMENCTLQEVTNALGDYSKIYHYIRNNKGNFVKRIANRNAKFFDQFDTIESLMKWIKINTNGTSKNEDNIYYTPDIIIAEHKCNCIDVAHFVHQYCLYKHIPNYLAQCGISYLSSVHANELSTAAHVFCVMQINGLWQVAQVDGVEEPSTGICTCVGFVSHSPLESVRNFANAYLNGMSKWLQEDSPDSLQQGRFVRLFTNEIAQQIDKMYLFPSDNKQSDFHSLTNRIPKLIIE